MKTEIIKPQKNSENNKSWLTPIIYLIVGVILAFKSNEAIQLLFYIIGILVILYGIKSFIDYYKNKDKVQYKNINLSIAVISIVGGILVMVLSEAIEVSIRYVLGFFLLYMGISRILTQISFNNYKNLSTVSNIVLIILGVYSIFVSNAVLVVIGWLLIINALIIFWETMRK
ncbi:MAG: DUF308 domain-containing protein [Bacilli bacterium]|nr:DUF308 domain-containing protein [Bacilli bacterium]